MTVMYDVFLINEFTTTTTTTSLLVIGYNRRGRNQAERNYATTKRQALALVERGDQEVPTVFTRPKIRSV